MYLTVEEFKGRRPLVRGGRTIPVDPGRLVNRLAVVHVLGHSSGSRGPRTVVPLDLAWVRDHAMSRRLVLEARNAIGWRHAVWGAPGGSEMVMSSGSRSWARRPSTGSPSSTRWTRR